MKNGKRFGLTIFQVVLSIVLIALIIFSVGVNFVLGSNSESGSIFGTNIFIMNNDSMASEEGIPNGAAVIADSDEIAVLTEGNVILFSEESGIENIMRIVEVVHDKEDTVYRVAADKATDKVVEVPKENVIAKCTVQSVKLGKVITFLKSMVGILAGMILPCLILLVMLMFKILSVRRREKEEDNIVYPETAFGIGNRENHNYSSNPLFDPSMAPKPDASFEMKKSSIAENFAMKPAAKKNQMNDKSERNMQTESAVEKFKAAVDEKPPVPVSRKASLAPEAAAAGRNEKMAAIKAALNNNEEEPVHRQAETVDMEKTTAFNIPDTSSERMSYAKAVQPQQPAAQTVEPVSAPAPTPVQNVAPTPTPAPKPSPRKQDNIKSIDDLIKALEEEKKKL